MLPVNQAKRIIDEVRAAMEKVRQVARQCGISDHEAGRFVTFVLQKLYFCYFFALNPCVCRKKAVILRRFLRRLHVRAHIAKKK